MRYEKVKARPGDHIGGIKAKEASGRLISRLRGEAVVYEVGRYREVYGAVKGNSL